MAGLLSLVSTPIGNLDDITLRALRVLREADVILAEDTRRTGVLTAHHGIPTRLRSLHAHTADAQLDGIAAELAAGARMALVSDAGTPVVSDPGHALVARAIALGVRVEGIPGPSAVTTAVVVSGLPCDHFRFVGFLPRTGSKRAAALEGIVQDTAASVFFEAPSRVGKTLSELAALALPERRAAACRELTKLHEEVRRGTLSELAAYFEESARGEFTVVVEGAPRDAAPDSTDDLEARAAALLADGMSVKTVAKALAATTSLSRTAAYDLALRVARPDGKPDGEPDAAKDEP
ncbi:MAG: 16S rRNA (cytidine(1402)-2'-O)-methyltransferase [Polyangiales bacterium]|nr:16S rRNA (cytidine(1402)-2'-O)-methyltransferase [Myxococcales bacterium]MCB9661220.1 16S rRNA (cytidine(1402)-2'-O)-methyltransferase [Sandaracinaceae bacterium]